ncbi:MBL fold metallo-hydrolase [Oceanispirochaeta sp.]|jgi:phosphoribosyl 1,2-cyclic phosphate phosphodiesterase|uniref:MBL fold metallo-hydrolase n=1 Tax=Oceanispirochaeta sp. TaxID=2035350 RepID=UPI002619A453|nr:MBL fold metallo-hydrolase [Oceanispirochaeta sp.]MDA3957012.1 MBL fold metallo-hydrolase [Oceanispirochaeta sp.]
MIITLLGTGTSHGVPVAGCSCPVCISDRIENNRYRCSLWIQKGDTSVIIDTAPEFRLQAIRAGITKVDGVVITHAHADHLHGIDDLRPFSWKKEIPIYAQKSVTREIRDRFPYIFNPPGQGGGTPQISLQSIKEEETWVIGTAEITAIPIMHGKLHILGYRIGNLAYITDCSAIPESSFSLLEGLEVLILGALRYKPHETHFSIPEAIEVIKKISPGRAYLTHLCHDVDHFQLKADLPKGIEPAWDGLKIILPE